jgi:hypothetical protein
LLALRDSDRVRTLVADLVAWARELMLSGAPLVDAVGGRAGWELPLRRPGRACACSRRSIASVAPP